MSENEHSGLPMTQVLAHCLLALAIVVTTLLAFYGYAPAHEKRRMQLQVRVRNETGALLQDVKINGAKFGDIGAGETTSYVRATFAYAVPALHYSLNGIQADEQPDDHIGDNPPEQGDFTYVLRMDSPRMPAKVVAILER